MLVKFRSSTSGEVMMFAESARVLLGVLGKECTARGVVTFEELSGEIVRLRAAMHRERGRPADAAADSGGELPVGFVQRATPFLELLERTHAAEGYVLWEAPADFGEA